MAQASCYFDHNATMPCSQKHLQQVVALLASCEGNPSTIHGPGRRAKRMLEDQRMEVAKQLGAQRAQVVFVSGATEANALILSSVAQHLKQSCRSSSSPPHRMVVAAGEHSSHLLNARSEALKWGLPYSEVRLTPRGLVDLDHLADLAGEGLGYVGFSCVHHETGLRQPVEQIAALISERAPAAHLHVDAAQAFGKEDLSHVARGPLDSVSVSAHKIGGLAGIGALYVRDREKMKPLFLGGGQERGLRAGTENLAGVVSLGQRCVEIAADPHWLTQPREAFDVLRRELAERSAVVVHGDQRCSAGLALSFSLRDQRADAVESILQEAGIAVGYGSACRSNRGRPWAVLEAMSVAQPLATESLRISLGPGNNVAQIRFFLQVLDEQICAPLPMGGRGMLTT